MKKNIKHVFKTTPGRAAAQDAPGFALIPAGAGGRCLCGASAVAGEEDAVEVRLPCEGRALCPAVKQMLPNVTNIWQCWQKKLICKKG